MRLRRAFVFGLVSSPADPRSASATRTRPSSSVSVDVSIVPRISPRTRSTCGRRSGRGSGARAAGRTARYGDLADERGAVPDRGETLGELVGFFADELGGGWVSVHGSPLQFALGSGPDGVPSGARALCRAGSGSC